MRIQSVRSKKVQIRDTNIRLQPSMSTFAPASSHFPTNISAASQWLPRRISSGSVSGRGVSSGRVSEEAVSVEAVSEEVASAVAESAEAASFTPPCPLMSISISLSGLTLTAPQRLLKLWLRLRRRRPTMGVAVRSKSRSHVEKRGGIGNNRGDSGGATVGDA